MNLNYKQSGHTFHIPVMGIAFTIDTPLKVAKFGISSAVSLVDDTLIEQVREYYCKKYSLEYIAIPKDDVDHRAKRIREYLNLLDKLIKQQVEELRQEDFVENSDIVKYFELLPKNNLKKIYYDMVAETDEGTKRALQEFLRSQIVAGSIDVNIMTKLDCDRYRNGEKLDPEYADALAALRGFATSSVNGAIVFSAGLNRRLYSYILKFSDFLPNKDGKFAKRIILKVSDYRSATIQGRFFAKRGIWISEFRIESGLNCGGHAFGANGNLMGLILEEFRDSRKSLYELLWKSYAKNLKKQGITEIEKPEQKITVQGGIGTAEETELLTTYYRMDGTGWGTPFLLVPEVVVIDDEHLEKLVKAEMDDIFLSDASPLGVKFWNLRNSASENKRRRLIAENNPGSKCPKHYLTMNSEFTKFPICLASKGYVKKKLAQISEGEWNDKQKKYLCEKILSKSCICHDLGGSAARNYSLDSDAETSVCTGPNIINFSRKFSLEEMVNHIYGRISLLATKNRPHMFITELALNVEHLKKELEEKSLELSNRVQSYFEEVKGNLMSGIANYRMLAERFIDEKRESFLHELSCLEEEIERLLPVEVSQ